MTVRMVPGVASAHAKELHSAGVQDVGDSMDQPALPAAAGTWLPCSGGNLITHRLGQT